MIKIENTLKTSVTYNGTGTQTRFDFPFDYLRKSFVYVSVNNELMNNTTDYTIDGRTVVFNTAPASGSVIRIYRETTTDRLVVWADASILKAADMTIQQIQQLHILEETNDWTKNNSIVLNDEGTAWQGRNYRLTNISDPVDEQDAVTKRYIDNEENSFMVTMNALKNQTEQMANQASTNANNAKKSENAAKLSETNAKNSETAAKLSETNAKNSEIASKLSETNAKTSENAAKTSETNAKTSADDAVVSRDAAQSAAETSSHYASTARNFAVEAKTYMDNAKNYSENVNVFVPSVSSAGVLSWTNKAGLPNPASVNIKGAKGDKGDTGAQGIQGIQGVKGDKGDRGAQGIQGVKGDKGDKGDTGAQGIQGVKGDKGATGAPGAAATIRIGNVVTGAPGTNVVVTNSGTSSAAVLNFQIPRGTPGADGGVTVDEVLNATSLNPVANKTVYAALQEKVTAEEITNTYAKKSDVSALLSIKLGITATAYAATRDGAGNNIVDTYAKKTDISGIVKSVNGKEPDAGGNVNVEEYTHPNSGVTAGTYRSVTVNAQGHVTAGSNTTLAIADGGTGANNASDACANIGALPTAGGIMTGAIKWDNNELLGNSSGSLTWAGKVVERINTIGKNYIRFESGLQICWGNTEITGNNNATSTVTLPIAFKNTNYSVTGTGSFGNLVSDISFGLVTIPTITTSNFTCKKLFGEKSTFRWVAIGYWK